MTSRQRHHTGIVSGRISGMAMTALSAFMMCGCASNECYENKNSLPYAGFYAAGSDMTQVSVKGLKVWGVGVPNDSLLADGQGSISNVYLPFKLDDGETQFVFELTGATDADGEVIEAPVRDVVTFRYECQPWFVSAACGAVYNYVIKDITYNGTLIDSISCPGNMITNENRENIRIFFNTASQDE